MAISNGLKKILSQVERGDKRALLDALETAGLVLSMDSECVDSAEDYRHVIDDIAQITAGALRPTSLQLSEGNPRRLSITSDGREASTELDGETDYMDTDRLIPTLNRVLPPNANRLWYVWDSELYGQDFGLAFVSSEERDALWNHGLPIAAGDGALLPSEPPGGRFAGHPAVGFTDGEIAPEELVSKLGGLTNGLLDLRKVEIDSANEKLRLELSGHGAIEVTTDSTEEGFCSFAEYPEGSIIEAMNKVLMRVGCERVFCTLFGPRNDTWFVVFVTPQEDHDLRNEYN